MSDLPYPPLEFIARLRMAAKGHLSDKPLLIVAAADEIERLRSLIDCAAKYWLDHFLTNPAIAWEGGIDKAMKAACGEIERLRAENAKLREAIANYESEQSNPVKDYTMVLRRRTELFAALAPKVSL